MFMNVLFFSLWSSNGPPLGLQRRTSGPPSTVASGSFPNTPVSPPDAGELSKLRQENAALVQAQSKLEGKTQMLQESLATREKYLAGRIEEFVREKAKFEAQIEQLRGSLAEQTERVGMSRQPSVTSTASPPPSPTHDMVPKMQLDVMQDVVRRQEESLRTVERERNLFQERAAELEAQLALPDVEKQKKEWQEKIEDLNRVMTALEKIKPKTVPGLDLSSVSRRESVTEQTRSPFNNSFLKRRASVAQRGGSPLLRARRVSVVGGTSPLSGEASILDQSLVLPDFRAFDEERIEHEKLIQAFGELKRYLAKNKRAESSSDDDVFARPAVSASAVPPSESKVVQELEEKLRKEQTAKSQVEVSLDAANKELARLRVGIAALLEATELTSNDLVYTRKEGAAVDTVTFSKSIPMREQLDAVLTHPALKGLKFGRQRAGALTVTAFPLLDELRKNHKRRLAPGTLGADVRVEKISSGWCC